MAKDRTEAQKSEGPPPIYAGCMPLEEVTIYDWMRHQNCKTTRYQHAEAYPNIRPPISRCDKQKTVQWMSESLEATGCARLVDNVPKDTVLEAWTNSPHKETLGCYGLGDGILDPQAVLFNQALSKSLQAASGVKAKPPPKLQPKLQKPPKQPSGAYVLNRECLRSQLARMPTIQRKLSPSHAFTWLHCPPPDPQRPPFEDTRGPPIPLTSALGMERTPRRHKQKPGKLRHPMCNLACDQPKNQCTDYEWKKYKEDPRPYDEAFRREQEAAQPSTEDEPKDYDELYARMLRCFEQSRDQNKICQDYEKCCKAPGDPPTQGCGEMVPEGADGGAGGKSDGDGGAGGGGKDGKDGGDGDGDGKDGGEGGDRGGKRPDLKRKTRGDGKYGDGKDGDGKGGDGDGDGDGDGRGGKGGRKDGKDGKGGDGKDGDGKGGDGKGGDGKGGDGKGGDGKGGGKGDKGRGDGDDGKGDGKGGKGGKGGDGKDGGLNLDDDGTFGKTSRGGDFDDLDGDGGGGGGRRKDGRRSTRDRSTLDSHDSRHGRHGDEHGGHGTDGTDGHGGVGDGTDGTDKDKDKGDGKDKKRRGDKGKRRLGDGGDGGSKGEGEEPVKDCPCELCNFCDKEPDTPLIREMRRRDKQRQQREYLLQMRHRQYMACRTPEYRAPAHKCQPIVCCDRFCTNPRLQDHLAKIDAVQQLQQQLQRCKYKNRASYASIHRSLDKLKQRLCSAFEMPEKC